jgi:hypothetical protein
MSVGHELKVRDIKEYSRNSSKNTSHVFTMYGQIEGNKYENYITPRTSSKYKGRLWKDRAGQNGRNWLYTSGTKGKAEIKVTVEHPVVETGK